MKKKIFFVVSSLGAGGSERVFWLLAQGFDKELYEVFIVHLGSDKTAFSIVLDQVTVVDLKTVKASRSFSSFYRLVKKEKPYAVFSTGAHINILVALVSIIIYIPYKIARESNVYEEMANIKGNHIGLWGLLMSVFYRVFDHVVCQSVEMKISFLKKIRLPARKLIIIPNPVLEYFPDKRVKYTDGIYKILIVARLAPEKAHFRLLDIMAKLPMHFYLTIAGDGPCRKELTQQIEKLGIGPRVMMLGEVDYVEQLLISHDVCVLTSLTEGFPNALLEAISHGTPVVAYKVGGLSDLIISGFNGYVVEQNNELAFAKRLQQACLSQWDHTAMIKDIQHRYALKKIANSYQALIG
jgi:glycosyltransferase involved in cell wall biosynthesis